MATQTNAILQTNPIWNRNDAATTSTLIQQNQLQILFRFEVKAYTVSVSTAQCCCVPDHLCRQPSDDCYFLLPGDAARPLCVLTFTLEPGFMERMWNISVYIRQQICECLKTMHEPLTIATKPCPYSFDSHKIGTAILEPFLWFLGARFVPLWPAGILWLDYICVCL